MSGSLKALLVGGPMYDPLYTRLAEFEVIQDLRVETVVACPFSCFYAPNMGEVWISFL